MLSLALLGLFELLSLVFLAQDACVVLDEVFENWFAFVQVDRHEAVRVGSRHLRVVSVHRSVFYQISDAVGVVLERLRVRSRVRVGRERAVPCLIHAVHFLQFFVDARHDSFACSSPLGLLLLTRRIRLLVGHD